MPKVLEIISNSINNDLQRFSNVSHNIANINTNGFKTQNLINTQLKSGELRPSLEAIINFSNGTLKKTQRNLDFAIQNLGFFLIENSDGTTYLTRNGSFSIDENQNLVTSSGDFVIGEQGQIIVEDENFSFNSDGSLIINNQVTNKIKLVSPNQPENLEYSGSSMYKLAKMDTFNQVQNPQLIQGSLETSNVSTSSQMIELIQLSRHMQSIQKAMQAYDNILNAGINTLGQR